MDPMKTDKPTEKKRIEPFFYRYAINVKTGEMSV